MNSIFRLIFFQMPLIKIKFVLISSGDPTHSHPLAFIHGEGELEVYKISTPSQPQSKYLKKKKR
jgi:hypothetical protein